MVNIEKMTTQLNKLRGKKFLKSEFKTEISKIYSNTYFYRAIKESGFVKEDSEDRSYFVTQTEPLYMGKVEFMYKTAYNISKEIYARNRPKEEKPEVIVIDDETADWNAQRKVEIEKAIKLLKSNGYLVFKAV
jgi:hypothetical protein